MATPSRKSEEGRKEFEEGCNYMNISDPPSDKWWIRFHILSREIAQLEAVKEWIEKELKNYRKESDEKEAEKWFEEELYKAGAREVFKNLLTFLDSEIEKIKGQNNT